jgi:TolA-binding protein
MDPAKERRGIMRKFRSFLFTLSALLAVQGLLGCQGFVTREGLREQDQKKEISDRVTNLQKSTADVNNRFSEIESDLREVHGRVEVVENRMSQNTAAAEKSKKVSDEQVAEMQKKLVILQEEIAKIQDQITSLASDLVSAKSANLGERADSKSDKNLYDAGEDLFEKKEWRKAILSYQKFRELKPKDKKIPDVIYKIGVSFQELGMKDEAKTFYEELSSKYPNSIEAKRAKIRLKKIK